MNTVSVYFEEKLIVFTSKLVSYLKTLKKDESFLCGNTLDANSFVDSFKGLLKSKNKKILIFEGPVLLNLNKFSSCFKEIKAAGGLIKSIKNDFLFIYRLQKWDLPKGKIEKGESIKKAAIRECEEECAVTNLKIIKTLAPSFHIYKLNGKWILKKTNWFLMSTNYDGKLKPQKAEGITKVEWINKKSFLKVTKNTYPSVLQVLLEIND
jgi:hypothetical protein